MHVDFDPIKVEWSAFAHSSPELAVVQYGGSYSIFRGQPYQRGAGIGSILRSFLRHLVPIGKEIGGAIGRQGLESGNRVLSNVLEGKNLKESLVTEGKAGLKNLLEKAANNLATQRGQGGFDFKRYNNNGNKIGGPATTKGIGKMGKSAAAAAAAAAPQKGINRLRSSVGPPQFLPAPPTKTKRRRKTTATSKKRKPAAKVKHLRVDSLGTY